MTASPQTIDIPTADAHPVRGGLYPPGGSARRGIVVLCHGFTGHRRWGFFPYLAGRLADAGFAALAIDFSLNGTLGGSDAGAPASPGVYTRPDLFERNTLRREFEDLSAVIDFIDSGGAGGGPVGLFGHSRGAVAAIAMALERPGIRALCTWSATDDPDFYTPAQKKRWRRDGRYAFTVAGGGELALGVDYLDDLEERRDFYHLGRRVSELQVPHLIVHGTHDLAIDPDCARVLHDAEASLEAKRLLLLRTGHTFGIEHPAPPRLERISKPLEDAVRETVAWFAAHTGGNT